MIVAPRTNTAVATTWQVDDLSVKENGKAYDYAWGITSPIDVSGSIGVVGGSDSDTDRRGRLILQSGMNGEFIVSCASSGSESYARMIFNHAYV